jgi:hypothetical protein
MIGQFFKNIFSVQDTSYEGSKAFDPAYLKAGMMAYERHYHFNRFLSILPTGVLGT